MENAVEKIRKLLALADSPNENEAKAAMAKAQELLTRHKMKRSDIENEDVKVVQHKTGIFYSRRKGLWKENLMQAIAESNCVGVCASRRKGAKTFQIMLIGTREDIDCCMELHKYASKFVTDHTKAVKREYLGWYTGAELTAIENSYGHGFAIGVMEILRRQKESNEAEWGLVIVRPKEVDDFIDSLRPSKTKANYNYSDESEWEHYGYLHGKKVTFNDKLKEGFEHEEADEETD